jgi:hypothetical protein
VTWFFWSVFLWLFGPRVVRDEMTQEMEQRLLAEQGLYRGLGGR